MPARGSSTVNREEIMHRIQRIAALGLVLATAACSGDAGEADLSYLEDLELVTSAVEARQGISALELGADSSASFVEAEPASPPVRSTSSRSSSSSAGTYSAPAPAPRARVETVKHTKRDAAIGAGAGAVIGAVAGGRRHRVQGAVVGAVVGGVIGGVIGNNVDKSTRVVYDFR
jgi:hypothetical protein